VSACCPHAITRVCSGWQPRYPRVRVQASQQPAGEGLARRAPPSTDRAKSRGLCTLQHAMQACLGSGDVHAHHAATLQPLLCLSQRRCSARLAPTGAAGSGRGGESGGRCVGGCRRCLRVMYARRGWGGCWRVWSVAQSAVQHSITCISIIVTWVPAMPSPSTSIGALRLHLTASPLPHHFSRLQSTVCSMEAHGPHRYRYAAPVETWLRF
jgi:hypothetical protein